jgi:hypothetical protein
MKYIATTTSPQRANATLAGRYLLVQPAPARHNLPTVEADNLAAAIALLKASPYTPPAPVSVLKTLTKRELVDKLIEAGIATEFNALLETLPLEEKLRWEASPTISPDYPYIRDNRTTLCAALGITSEQLDNLFH